MGMYYEDLPVGKTIKHEWGRTITESDNTFFSMLTMNMQPLHTNQDFASKTEFGQRLVNGLFTLALVVGISVNDITTGTIIANLGYENVKHPHPVFHGDTVYVETEVIAARESKSRPNTGIVTMTHYGRNQHGKIVIEVTRSALFLKRPESE
ncbi:MAG: MaoC family dehydratase [Anaerolineae bacterium]|nr:MaoC family dehydratase [Anaerolineae bacterium]